MVGLSMYMLAHSYWVVEYSPDLPSQSRLTCLRVSQPSSKLITSFSLTPSNTGVEIYQYCLSCEV